MGSRQLAVGSWQLAVRCFRPHVTAIVLSSPSERKHKGPGASPGHRSQAVVDATEGFVVSGRGRTVARTQVCA